MVSFGISSPNVLGFCAMVIREPRFWEKMHEIIQKLHKIQDWEKMASSKIA